MFKDVNSAIRDVYEKKGTLILGALVVGLFVLESRYALRKRKASKIGRIITNGEVAATAAVGFRYFLVPALVWAAMKSESGRRGILYHLPFQAPIKNFLGFMFVDYGNYIWHRLSHGVPWLWRFHQVHHSDLDLDLSTAFRFHIGEILPSALYRAAIVWMLGLSWKWVLYYEIAFEAANNFHHSNLKLSPSIAENLTGCFVTPAMHGVHHSIVLDETSSNFSVIFSVWDRLHQTLKLDIPQESIDIGMPAYRDENELSWSKLMTMPFKRSRSWALPDGRIPKRL